MTRQDEKEKAVASPIATRNVFLDTQAYRSFGHNPYAGVLVELAKKVEAHELKLHITDITLWEIRRQLIEMAEAAGAELKKARRSYGGWRKRLPSLLPDLIPEFDPHAVGQAAFDAFERDFITQLRVLVHPASQSGSAEVFKSYFAGQSTFRSRASKEFPDAFVVLALDEWCAKHNDRMYVIGADKAMTQAVDDCLYLLSMPTLTEFMERSAAGYSPDFVREVGALVDRPEFLENLEQSIRERELDLAPIYTGSLAEGEAIDQSVDGPVEVVLLRIIASTQSDLSLFMRVKVPLTIRVHYEDRSHATYDRELDLWINSRAADIEITAEPEIRVFARFSRSKLKIRSFEIIDGEFSFEEPIDEWD